MVVPTEMKMEGKAKELLMPEETFAHRKHGILFIPPDRLFLLFCCDADGSAFVVGVLGANAREAC